MSRVTFVVSSFRPIFKPSRNKASNRPRMCNSVCANSSSRILRKTTSLPASSGRTSGVNISLCLEHRVFIKQIEMRELRMRLLHPFETSFGSTQDRHVIVVKVRDGKEAGWGEVTAAEGPFYSYETWETAWHLLRDFISPRVVGKEFEEPTDFACWCAAYADTIWQEPAWKRPYGIL